jgi:hypothetical protein
LKIRHPVLTLALVAIAIATVIAVPDVGAGLLLAMSWSISYPDRASFVADKGRPEYLQAPEEPEVTEQIVAARKAAELVIESGAVGRDVNVPGGHKDFSVTIGGHANPGHEKTPGWANDAISIHITQQDVNADLSQTAQVAAAEAKAKAGAGATADNFGEDVVTETPE